MIFNFDHYRPYLKAYLQQLPHRGFGEARKIAAHLGVSSTYVSHILSGSKDLTLEQSHSLGKYLGLSEIEMEYFFFLVQLERAGNQELKKFCQQKLRDLKKRSLKLADRIEVKRSLSEEEKSIFYSSPIFSMVHIFSATHKRGRTVEEIAQRFEIPRSRAVEVTRFLVTTGLCEEKDGHFLTGNQGTHLEQGSPYLLKHHTNWRLRAVQAAENLREEELMYTVNVALSEVDFGQLREEMVRFIKNFLEKIYPSPSEEIACLNLDWFWIRK